MAFPDFIDISTNFVQFSQELIAALQERDQQIKDLNDYIDRFENVLHQAFIFHIYLHFHISFITQSFIESDEYLSDCAATSGQRTDRHQTEVNRHVSLLLPTFLFFNFL